MKQWIGLLIFLFLLPLPTSFCAENMDPSHFTIRAFTAPEDLPNEVVRDVIMAKEGSVWIATWGGGVVIMNGTEKQIINTDDGLISNDVRVLEEDREGRIWVGTAEGISCIQNQEIINFSTIPLPEIPANDSLFSIESIHNGEVWFGDGFGNLFAWMPSNNSTDVRKGQWKYIHNFWEEVKDKTGNECSIRKIEQYKDNSIWLAVNYVGLVKINSPSDFKITLWETTLGYCFDFFIVNAIQQYVLEYRGLSIILGFKGEGGIYAPANTKCIKSAFGTIFIGTEQGLYHFNLNEYQLHPFPLTTDNRLFCIESLSFLRDGSLWVGTRSGAFRITLSSWVPQSFSAKNTALFHENYDPDYKQKALALDQGGRLWAYQNHGWKSIHQFDRTFNTASTLYARSDQLLIHNGTESIQFDLSQLKISDQFTRQLDFTGSKKQIYLSQDQEIWYTGMNGVNRRKKNQYEPVFDLPPDIDPEVFSILQNGPEDYWIGGKGWLGRYHNRQFELPAIPPSFLNKNSAFLCSMQTQESELWFSQLGQGVLRYKNNQWYRDNPESGLPSNYIVSLIQSHDGTVWAGDRNNGVMSYKDGRWIKYDFKDGIPIGSATTIVEDEDGNIWVGMDVKILISSTETVRILCYRPDRTPPAIQILSASDRLVPDAPGVFSFQGYDAWNDTLREELVYSWRVLQKDQDQVVHDWNPYTPKNSALVPPLPPGDYLFEVRAQDRHRNTSPVNAKSAFIVEPYFWMNRYFQVPFALALFFASLSFYMYWKRYKQKMEGKILQEKISFSEFCDATHIGVFRLTQEGKIVYMNSAMKHILGLAPSGEKLSRTYTIQWINHNQFDQFRESLFSQQPVQPLVLKGKQTQTENSFYVLLYGVLKETIIEIMAVDLTQQKRLEKEILTAGAQEQQKLGRDLHDTVVQELTGISFFGQAILDRHQNQDAQSRESLAILVSLINETRNKIWQISKGLSPINLGKLGFQSALQEQVATIQKLYPVECVCEYDSAVVIQNPETEFHLYHIAHEALHNAAKHSKATIISVRLTQSDNKVVLTIRDNGIGISAVKKQNGLGMDIMSLRASMILADLDIFEPIERGTVVECRYSLDSDLPEKNNHP